MDKKLEKMRTEVKERLIKSRGFMACLVILLVVVNMGVLPKSTISPEFSDYMQGFQSGLLLGITIVAFVFMLRYQQALKDDAKLKELYYKEHDERQNYIGMMAGKNSMKITMVVFLIGAVIAGYYSIEVFAALLVAALVEGLVTIGLKVYYDRHFTGNEE